METTLDGQSSEYKAIDEAIRAVKSFRRQFPTGAQLSQKERAQLADDLLRALEIADRILS